MTNRLRIILVFGCALVAAAAIPAAAGASPLLSGYGGPGQGNQAILGSTLLGGSGGGGSSGASAVSASAGETSGASIAAPTAAQPASANATGTGTPAAHHGSTSAAAVRHTAIPPAHGALPASLAYARAERGSSPADSGLLGLSGADLLYAALVLGALALTTVLMRRLMRPTPAKGHG